MKKVKLNDKQIQQLINIPETGMGYQLVRAIFNNGKIIRNLKVLNSEYLLLNDDQELDIYKIIKFELEP